MARYTRRNVHVVPAGGRGAFVVKLAGGRRLTPCPMTQGDAIRRAIPEAVKRRSEVVIHRPDGRIRDKDSYGRDSKRWKDRKH